MPIDTLEAYFDRQEPRNFPFPKKRKPYTRERKIGLVGYEIFVQTKDTGSAKISLIDPDGEKQVLYFQGLERHELDNEVNLLKQIILRGDKE